MRLLNNCVHLLIKELVDIDKAQEPVFDRKYEVVKTIFLLAIKAAIYQSSDVTKADRKQIVLKIEDFLHELGLQNAKSQKRSLYSIMQRPLPPIDAATEAELASLEKLPLNFLFGSLSISNHRGAE